MALKINSPNFGGWVSENFLGIARFNRWLFSVLPLLKKDESYIEPNRPYTTWNVSELNGWLRSRGISDKGRKSELLLRVTQGKEVINPVHEKPISVGVGIDTNTVLNVLKSFSVMIGHVMQRKVDDHHISRTCYAIKNFLSAYHMLDEQLQLVENRQSSMSYGWLTSYNFICLMNLPSTMKAYGPITNLWEGGEMGEKYSQQLKPRLKGGLKGNWHVNILTHALKQDAMSRIQLPTGARMWVKPVVRERRNKSYLSAIDVITTYNKREALSVVFFADGCCGAMLRQGNEYVEILLHRGTIVLYDLHYWSIMIANTVKIKPVDLLITNYCILLPRLCTTGIPQPTELDVRYTIIESTRLDAKPCRDSQGVQFVIPST